MAIENFIGANHQKEIAADHKKQLQELLRLVNLSEREWMIYRERFGCMTSYEFLQERLTDFIRYAPCERDGQTAFGRSKGF